MISQRTMMRTLYRNNPQTALRLYAAAEACGLVQRVRNKHSLTAAQYATKLVADGLRKGWIF